MNEIILNGTSNTELKGLIIQTLPPITKPKMRNRAEEIDGRDGDIITLLGYSAYDKTFTIGLSYDYDIDEIIDYFNRSGTVTFSNEPDKYYNYTILEQIDFEKLIRYKTATVTMHVQPFKYSTIETLKSFETNLLVLQDYTKTLNGMTVKSYLDGKITVEGRGTAATEFYIPIPTLTLTRGYYILSVYAAGDGVGNCSIRLINNSPSAANSFGGTYVTLSNNQEVTITSDITETKYYNYLYFYIVPNTDLLFTMHPSVDNNTAHFVVRNNGNYFSRPRFTIFGTGTINMKINDFQIFVINLGEERYITIDTAAMEAYKDAILKNRLVTGNYENCVFTPGVNTIDLEGNVTEFYVENYSRWI